MNERPIINAMLRGMRETYDKENFELVVPDLAPSVNKLYFQRSGGPQRFLNPKVKVFAEVLDLHIGRKQFNPSGPLACLMVFQGPWINKGDGLIKKSDLDNRIKVTLDSLVKSRIKFRDELIWQLFAFKEHHPDERQTEIHLFSL